MRPGKYHIYTRINEASGRRFWYLERPSGRLVGGPYAHSATVFHAFRHYTRELR